jgi:hypothetical protein
MYQLNPNAIVQVLAEQNISAEPGQTMKEIAAANGIDPHGVYAVIYTLAKR